MSGPRGKAKVTPAEPVVVAPPTLEARQLSGGPFGSTVLVCSGPAGCGAIVGDPARHLAWHAGGAAG